MSTSKVPPQGQRPIAKPKSMSSKLLTMKFMQRSAAPTEVRAALEKEESAREAVREKIEASITPIGDAETRWELSYAQSAIARAAALPKIIDCYGYGELMASDTEDEDSEAEHSSDPGEKKEKKSKYTGRMVFGSFKSRAETKNEDVESGDEESDEDGPKPIVSLRGLTSISNPGPAAPGMKCRGCGEEGHTMAKCPKAKCYACDGEGHMAKDCPRPRKGKKRDNVGSGGDVKRRRSGN